MSHPIVEGRADDAESTPLEVRAYLSDMLAELADMARGLGDSRLEQGLRLLALDAAAAPG